MAKFCSLFSGSSGNCTIVNNKTSSVLIDAGVSAKRITEALCDRNFDPSQIGGIFVTHEHIDHISGIRVFCKKNKIPVYMTAGTYKSMELAGTLAEGVDYKILDGATDMGDISVSFFHTSHDTPESCGYILDLGSKKVAVCTDLGVVTDEVKFALEGCDTVMLESNHDVKMLQNNPYYPFPLKRRILSQNGHLSNNACAEELLSLAKSGTTRFFLAHLSKENNLPPLAKETAKSLLFMSGMKENCDFELTVCTPNGIDTAII